jgi:hypothetical protein
VVVRPSRDVIGAIDVAAVALVVAVPIWLRLFGLG